MLHRFKAVAPYMLKGTPLRGNDNWTSLFSNKVDLYRIRDLAVWQGEKCITIDYFVGHTLDMRHFNSDITYFKRLYFNYPSEEEANREKELIYSIWSKIPSK